MDKRAQPTSEPAILRAEHLDAGHAGHNVLKNLNLKLASGKMTVLLGPNGSGKSTLLASLSRLLPAQRGSVFLQQRNIADIPSKQVARTLGLLPQQPSVPEDLSVKDLVARGRFPHQGLLKQWSEQDQQAVAEAMRLTATTHLAARLVDSLSGGQRQRVWIAMILAQQTELILLDEPTSFLDMRHQVELLELLRDLVKHHGRTIVCVLHDLNLALQYTDHLVFLKQGQILHQLEHPSQCTTAIVEQVFETPLLAVPHPQTGLPIFLSKTAPNQHQAQSA
ncbi:ABC transporter ATP-binding protein [Agarivorans sp. QJM3NY_33]|uniref:ABC transporter ATP-binding protein n=1 Tax=Agarivorans sp. QJM3NY_33 TaxID=3421432 RepID=UPI003D7DDAE7